MGLAVNGPVKVICFGMWQTGVCVTALVSRRWCHGAGVTALVSLRWCHGVNVTALMSRRWSSCHKELHEEIPSEVFLRSVCRLLVTASVVPSSVNEELLERKVATPV
jgi:hypothetical protein